MSFQVKEPILFVGLGGAGSKLALQAKNTVDSDCLLISNDQKDLQAATARLRCGYRRIVIHT